MILDCPGGLRIITKVLLSEREKQERDRKRFEDATSGPRRRRKEPPAMCAATSRSWKRLGNRFAPGASRKKCSLVLAQ